MRRFNFGRRFNVPRVGKNRKYAKATEQITGNFEMYPKIPGEESHPLPFYKTPEITLPAFTDPPWKEAVEMEERERFQEMSQNQKLLRAVRSDLLNEAIDEEIIALASLLVTEDKMEETMGHETIVFAEKEIFHPVIQKEVLICVWELLYEWGRNLSQNEFKEMQKREKQLRMSPKSIELLSAHMHEGLAWSENLSEEKQLSGERWEVLLYNYRAKLQHNSFQKNEALNMAQVIIISQIAAEEVMKKGVLSLMEEDMVVLDEKEKMKMPPREG